MHTTTIDDQTLAMLQASMQRYGADKYSFAARRGHLNAAPWFNRTAWQDYAALGWLALPLGESEGGSGSHPAAIGALMRFAGEALALEPLFAGVVLCAPLLAACQDDDAAREHLGALCAGQRHFALAHAEDCSDGIDGAVHAEVRDGKLHGRKLIVLHGDAADWLIVSARDAGGGVSLYLARTVDAQVRKSVYRLLDGRGAASFEFDGAPVQPLGPNGAGTSLLDAMFEHARLAMCSEAQGAMLALNRDTLAYLKTRKQFGRPIGTNQTLQHRMTEMMMVEEESAAVIGAAQRAAARGGEVWRRAVHGAAAQVMHAGRHISHEAVQLHGGIGMTDELPVSHYFKRIMVINRLLGDRDAHLAAFAAADAKVHAQRAQETA